MTIRITIRITTIRIAPIITILHILYACLSLRRLFPQATALWVLKTPAARRGVATGRESRPAGGRCPAGGSLVAHMIVTGFWFKLASRSPPPAHFSRYKTWFGGRLPIRGPIITTIAITTTMTTTMTTIRLTIRIVTIIYTQ